MKNLMMIALAGALLSATACDFKESNSDVIHRVLQSTEEQTGSVITLTTLDWNDEAFLVGGKKTVNGETMYTDDEFDYNDETMVLTYYRTLYDGDDGMVDYREKRVESYMYGWAKAYGQEVFRLGEGGSDTTPTEYWKEIYDSQGLLAGYEAESDGLRVVQDDYEYDYSEVMTYTRTEYTDENPEGLVKNVTVTYLDYARQYLGTIETRVDNELVEYTRYTYDNGASTPGYEKYIGGDDETGTLVEKLTEHQLMNDGMVASYRITRYDEDGLNPVITNVEKTYKLITVKYKE